MGYVPNLYFPTRMGLLHRQAANRLKSSTAFALELALLEWEATDKSSSQDTKLLWLRGVILKKLTFLLLGLPICTLRLKVLLLRIDGRIKLDHVERLYQYIIVGLNK